MIVRDVDVYNLESFDFFNDAEDTFHWLCRMTRRAEALELHRKWMVYQHMEMADMAGCTACGGEGGVTDFPPKEGWIAPDHEAAEVHRKQTEATLRCHRAVGEVVCVREAEHLDEVECLVWFDGDDHDNKNVMITTPAGIFQVRDKIEVIFQKLEAR
jgi:hypothetical protein